MGYEDSAKEVLRLMGFFEKKFIEGKLYCGASVVDGSNEYRWRGAFRGFEYRAVGGCSEWFSVKNVNDMEAMAGLVLVAEELYDAVLKEQSRIAKVLDKSAEVGNDFADRLISKEREDARIVGTAESGDVSLQGALHIVDAGSS
tara:strand:- start:157 stop:588 length:432 start_codon:yes stop_codon:yes gene_type:complete